jgi:hypothetical protein
MFVQRPCFLPFVHARNLSRGCSNHKRDDWPIVPLCGPYFRSDGKGRLWLLWRTWTLSRFALGPVRLRAVDCPNWIRSASKPLRAKLTKSLLLVRQLPAHVTIPGKQRWTARGAGRRRRPKRHRPRQPAWKVRARPNTVLTPLARKLNAMSPEQDPAASANRGLTPPT